MGTETAPSSTLRSLLLAALLLSGIGLIVALAFLAPFPDLRHLPGEIDYLLAFSIGLMTGFHCVGMCGALLLAVAPAAGSRWAPLLYAFGKTLSYTLLGGLLGGLGRVVAITPSMRGGVALLAGLFLIVYGIGQLHLFRWWPRIEWRMSRWLQRLLGRHLRRGSPFLVGLANGLMIVCGPLQAMYVMAMGLGDPLRGALLLLSFGIGTLPLMIGFGFLVRGLAQVWGGRIVKLSALVVVAMGVLMVRRGLEMSGLAQKLDASRLEKLIRALSTALSGF